MGEGGSKIPKILTTWFMDDPYVFILDVLSLVLKKGHVFFLIK